VPLGRLKEQAQATIKPSIFHSSRRIEEETEPSTFIPSSRTKRSKRPVVVRIPVQTEGTSLTIHEAENIVLQAGGKPMTKSEIMQYRRVLRNPHPVSPSN
jgi:hypothetical protein